MLLTILMATFIHADLPRFPDPPSELTTVGQTRPIPCAEIESELLKFKEKNRQHEEGVIAFQTQATEKIQSWYTQLQPLEGKTAPVGIFEPIRDGGQKMSKIVDYSYDNTALLAEDLDRIILSLGECNLKR